MDGAQGLGAEQVAEVGRHAREAATIASNDEQHDDLKAEGVSFRRQLEEGQGLDEEKEDVRIGPADIIRYGRPGDAAGAVQKADEADHGCSCHGRHADDFLGHRRSDSQKGDAAGDVDEKEPPNRIELPGFHSLFQGKLRHGVGIDRSGGLRQLRVGTGHFVVLRRR